METSFSVFNNLCQSLKDKRLRVGDTSVKLCGFDSRYFFRDDRFARTIFLKIPYIKVFVSLFSKSDIASFQKATLNSVILLYFLNNCVKI